MQAITVLPFSGICELPNVLCSILCMGSITQIFHLWHQNGLCLSLCGERLCVEVLVTEDNGSYSILIQFHFMGTSGGSPITGKWDLAHPRKKKIKNALKELH